MMKLKNKVDFSVHRLSVEKRRVLGLKPLYTCLNRKVYFSVQKSRGSRHGKNKTICLQKSGCGRYDGRWLIHGNFTETEENRKRIQKGV